MSEKNTSEKTKVLEYDAAQPKQSRVALYIVIALLIVSWALLLVIGNYSYNMGLTLTKKIDALSAQTNTTSYDPSDNNNHAIDIENLTQRIDFLEDQLDLFSAPIMEALSEPDEETVVTEDTPTEIHTAPKAPAPQAIPNDQIKALEKHLAQSNALLAKTVEKNTNSMLLIAVINLKDAMLENDSYSKELAAVQALSQGNRMIANGLPILQSSADDGIPSLSLLESSFDKTITSLLKADNAASPSQNNVTGWFKRTIADVVQIRKIGDDVEGDSIEAIIARAEAYMHKGKLIEAVKEMELLQGEPLEIARPWILLAKTRIAALRTVDTIYKHVVTTSYQQ